MREVQYYDKSRMEINNPNGNPDDLFYVTNGLLVVELITRQRGQPLEIAIDANGNVVVANADNARVQIFSPTSR